MAVQRTKENDPNEYWGGILKQHCAMKPKSKTPVTKGQRATADESRCGAEVVRNTVLGAEVVDERIPRSRSGVFGHVLQKLMDLSKVLALVGRCNLDEFFPSVGVRQPCRPETIEDLVLRFDGGDHWSVDGSADELLHLGLC